MDHAKCDQQLWLTQLITTLNIQKIKLSKQKNHLSIRTFANNSSQNSQLFQTDKCIEYQTQSTKNKTKTRLWLNNTSNWNVTGPRRRYLGGVIITPEYWLVMVFKTSGIVDRPYEFLYVRTIPMYMCMDRLSRYTPFSYQSWLVFFTRFHRLKKW